MKKLSVLAIALAATCMFSGCGKETKQNVQPAEETYKNTESETSEECAAAEYYGAAEPPVRCGESHLSGLTEPLRSL